MYRDNIYIYHIHIIYYNVLLDIIIYIVYIYIYVNMCVCLLPSITISFRKGNVVVAS